MKWKLDSPPCPTVSLADIYAQASYLYHAAKRSKAFAMFGRIQAFGTMNLNSGNPMMVARGMFKLTTLRAPPPEWAAAAVVVAPRARGGGGRAVPRGRAAGGGRRWRRARWRWWRRRAPAAPARSPAEEVRHPQGPGYVS